MVKHKYFQYSPRGFSNETTFFRIPSNISQEDKAIFDALVDDINNDINSWCYTTTRKRALADVGEWYKYDPYRGENVSGVDAYLEDIDRYTWQEINEKREELCNNKKIDILQYGEGLSWREAYRRVRGLGDDF